MIRLVAPLRTHVVGWRPNPDTGTNFRSRFAVQGTRKLAKAKPAPTDPPPITKLLAQAEAWQRELNEGAMKSRAAIAAREGVSAMRVGSILALLKLHPEIREWIRSLPPGTPPRKVTERALRPIARMSVDGQLVAAGRRWGMTREMTSSASGSPREFG
jgi:hypothetical protein